MDIQGLLYYLQSQPVIFALMAGILGLMIGSFLNVVICRYPKQLEWRWRQDALSFLGLEKDLTPEPPNVIRKSSHCPQCGHSIRWWENIPVLSFIFLRGKCHGCQTSISFQYPLVEIITGVLFAIAAYQFGPSLFWLMTVIGISILIAASGIDLKIMILPDSMMYALLWLGLLASILGVGMINPTQAIVGAMVGYLSLWSVFWAFKWITGKEGMGHGDFKLLAALGAWVGALSLLPVILLAAITGSILGLIQLRRTQESQPFPFGPFIALGGLVEWISGGALRQLMF